VGSEYLRRERKRQQEKRAAEIERQLRFKTLKNKHKTLGDLSKIQFQDRNPSKIDDIDRSSG
jgi:hypothetical protein